MAADVLTEADTARERARPVIRREVWEIGKRRQRVGPLPDVEEISADDLWVDPSDKESPDLRENVLKPGYIGLAISGGGIRSATFALGLLQALAKADVLKFFDYMSTVSGGGYIGGSLTWMLRNFDGNPKYGLAPSNFPFGTAKPRDRWNPQHWQGILRYLREHGQYLTPGGGITFLSGLAVALRGILLNLIVWFPILTAIFVIVIPFAGWFVGAGVVAFAVFVAACVIYSLGTKVRRKWWPFRITRYALRRFFEIWIKWPLLLSAFLLVVGTLPFVVQYFSENDLKNWLLSSASLSFVAGVAGAFSRFSNSKGPKLGIVAPLAAALFLYGFAVLACWTATVMSEGDPAAFLVRGYFVSALVVSLGTAVWVNLNYISLHRYYRDRLMESFLPDQENVDRQKTGPAKEADKGRLSDMWNPGSESPQDSGGSPYHIVNTNLILVDSENRKRRMRGGESFILTPHFCGSDATDYVRTRDFMDNGMTLSTAIAISGAAANPDTGVGGSGVLRNRLVSWLLALLNIRLGYWTPNPQWLLDGRVGRYRRPPNHLTAFAYDISLIKGFDERNKWLQLSDGGHFENLGLYELIRRRTRLIVVSDAGADPDYSFGDLRNAILRVGQDFRATITFGPVFWRGNEEPDRPRDSTDARIPGDREYLSKLIPSKKLPAHFPHETELAERGYIIGTIDYGPSHLGTRDYGIIIFVKSTLVRGLSLETRGYRKEHPTFPDQSTADQFFDEQQFEAYRELGFVIGDDMIRNAKLKKLIARIRR